MRINFFAAFALSDGNNLRTIAYIDGFNLYHRKLKGRRWARWVNVFSLVESCISSNNIISHVNYYTARVSGQFDQKSPRNQKVYLNALNTIPNLFVHFGKFQISDRWIHIVPPLQVKPEPKPPLNAPDVEVVKAYKIEEKGSDVNLASHLLRDGYLDNFEVAVVVSADADLVEPIRIVVEELGKVVVLVSPRDNVPRDLERACSSVKRITNSRLRKSLLPEKLEGEDGVLIVRPDSWCEEELLL